MPAPDTSDLRPRPSPEALAFALAQPDAIPGDDPHAAPVLEVYVVLGEDVAEVVQAAPGTPVQAGVGCAIPVALEELPHDRLTVFEPVPGEAVPTWALRFAPSWGGHLGRRGTLHRLGDLRAAGLASPEPDGLLRVTLEPADQVLVEIGRTTVIARPVRPARRVPRTPVTTVEPAPAGIFSFVVVSLALLAVALATVPPAPAATRTLGDAPGVTLLLRPPPPPAPTPTVTPKHGDTGSGERGASRPRRGGGGHKEGPGLLSAFDNAALTDALGSALPSGVLSGVRGLVGRRATGGNLGPGPGLGLGGPGVAAVGDWVGGGDRTGRDGDAWGGVRLTKRDGPDVTKAGEVIQLGNIRPEVIDQVVKRHLASIRYCYQRELQRAPSLAGKLSVKFTIAADGSVSSSNTQASGFSSPATEACVNDQFRKMTFPPLQGGGVAIVKYPFWFSPG